VQHAFGTLFQLGVFDRFPKLRVVVLEELKGMIAPMSESGRRRILGENVARAYQLM